MKAFTLILTLLSFTYVTSGQEFNWAKQVAGPFGEYSVSLDLDHDNNVYTAGYFSGNIDGDPSSDSLILINQGDLDIFVSKLSSSGDFVWAKHFGGPGRSFVGGLDVDDFGNVYTVGYFQDTVDFDPNAGVYNVYSNGIFNFLPWNSQVTTDIFLSKLNKDGEFVWAKMLEASYSAQANGVTSDALGNVYVGGSFSNTIDCDPSLEISNLISLGGDDGFVCKLDSLGNFIWAKNVVSSTQECVVSGIATDNFNNLICTGTYRGLADIDPTADTIAFETLNPEMFISKYSPSGELLWVKNFNGDAFNYAKAVTTDSSGNIYLTGNCDGTTDFDPGPDSYEITTVTFTPFIVKLNSDGDFIWASFATGSGGGLYGGQTSSVSVDQNQNVFFSGIFDESFDFDPGIDTFNLTATGDWDGFICKLNSDGSFGWAVRFGDYSQDKVQCVKANSNNELYATGYFRGTVDFDSSPDVHNLVMDGNGTSDVFVLKLGTDLLTGLKDDYEPYEMTVYPNPTTGQIQIDLASTSHIISLRIYNIAGQLVQSEQINTSGRLTHYLPNQRGMYLIQLVHSDGHVTNQKVVKE